MDWALAHPDIILAYPNTIVAVDQADEKIVIAESDEFCFVVKLVELETLTKKHYHILHTGAFKTLLERKKNE